MLLDFGHKEFLTFLILDKTLSVQNFWWLMYAGRSHKYSKILIFSAILTAMFIHFCAKPEKNARKKCFC